MWALMFKISSFSPMEAPTTRTDFPVLFSGLWEHTILKALYGRRYSSTRPMVLSLSEACFHSWMVRTDPLRLVFPESPSSIMRFSTEYMGDNQAAMNIFSSVSTRAVVIQGRASLSTRFVFLTLLLWNRQGHRAHPLKAYSTPCIRQGLCTPESIAHSVATSTGQKDVTMSRLMIT